MTEHVDTKRLHELSQLRHIFDEPEWEHMRRCDLCLEQFADLVRQDYYDKKAKTASDSAA